MTQLTIDGADKAIKALTELGEIGRRYAEMAVRDTAERLRTDAISSIQSSAKSGIVYERGPDSNLSATHQASAPGEAPANDTGNLVGSIRADHIGLVSDVTAAAEYAEWLEFGTMLESGAVRMLPRPFMTPARDKAVPRLHNRLAQALSAAIKDAAK